MTGNVSMNPWDPQSPAYDPALFTQQVNPSQPTSVNDVITAVENDINKNTAQSAAVTGRRRKGLRRAEQAIQQAQLLQQQNEAAAVNQQQPINAQSTGKK